MSASSSCKPVAKLGYSHHLVKHKKCLTLPWMEKPTGNTEIENDTAVNSFGYVQFGSALVAGGIAGVAVDASLYPIDTIKTRLQSERGLWKTGGFRGIYRGLSAVCVGSFPTAALFFVTYEASKSILMSHLPKKFEPVSHMAAASSGEVMACLFRVPCEIAKQRAQASKDSPLKHLRVAFKQEGFAGLYRGYLSTVLREVPFSFLQFPMWEFLKAEWSQIEGHQIDAWQSAICGAGSGAFASSLTTPLDVAKTRIMLAKTGTPFAENSIIFALKEIRKEHGISGWFAGMVPRVFWISLGGAIFLGVYDKVLSLEKAVFVDKIS